MPPAKQLGSADRTSYGRIVMAYLKDLGEIRPDLFPLPKRKKDETDPLALCIQDYNHVRGYLSSIADYEGKAIILNMQTDDKSKQLVLIPNKGLGYVKIEKDDIKTNSKVAQITNKEALELFNISSQDIADEIDRALYILNLAAQDRFYKANPGYDYRTAGGHRFPPLEPTEKSE